MTTPANFDEMAGWLKNGQSAQSLRQPPQTEILAQAEVGKPAVRRNDNSPKTRASRKPTPKAPRR